jgi:hypothetical protein
MTWKSMDSAPTDGTRVLVRYEKCAGYFDVAECYAEDYTNRGATTWRMRGCSTRVVPTHWQPLSSTDLSAPSPIVEAEIRGMRAGFAIARSGAWADVEHHLDTAIHALREGGGR